NTGQHNDASPYTAPSACGRSAGSAVDLAKEPIPFERRLIARGRVDCHRSPPGSARTVASSHSPRACWGLTQTIRCGVSAEIHAVAGPLRIALCSRFCRKHKRLRMLEWLADDTRWRRSDASKQSLRPQSEQAIGDRVPETTAMSAEHCPTR